MTLKKTTQILFVMAMLGTVSMEANAQTTETTIYVCKQADGSIKLQNIHADKNCTAKTTRISTPTRLPRTPTNMGYSNTAVSTVVMNPQVSQQLQGQRDAGRAAILQSELSAAQSLLAQLQSEYQNGTPERRGDERNYQKYLDRTEQLKQKIKLAQDNIDALTRELRRTF